MRVVVFVVFLAEEHAAFCEETDDRAVGVEDERACEFRDAAIGGEAAVVVDGGEETEAVFASGDVVFLAVAWGGVDLAGAGVIGDEVGADDLGGAVEERVLGEGAC